MLSGLSFQRCLRSAVLGRSEHGCPPWLTQPAPGFHFLLRVSVMSERWWYMAPYCTSPPCISVESLSSSDELGDGES